MVTGYRTLAYGLLCCMLSPAAASAVTPIEKVVVLLKKLSTQISEEGKVEAAEYDKYACFCKEQADEKQYAIETSQEKIDTLKAKEDELKKSIGSLNQDISDLSKKIGDFENEIKTASDKRAGELATYRTEATDLSDAISACERAIEAMKESKGNVDGKVDLAQFSAQSPLLAASLLAATSKQEPPAYEYSANDIIGTLENLLATFKQNKNELDVTEMNAKQAHNLKEQDMQNQKSFSEKDKFEKEEQSEAQSETLAATSEEKDDETKSKDADSEFLKVLTSDCEEKATVFDQRSSTRSSEVSAITKALEDLEKNAMDNYKATGLADLQKPASFLQMRNTPGKASLLATSSRIAATQRVLDLLLKKIGNSNSPVLSSLTMKVMLLQQGAGGIDHFVKVRQLIKDLLAKLDADAKSEATTKAYCDTNMKKQTEVRDSSKLKIEETSAALTIANADLMETKQKIADLEAAIAKNLKGLNEAGELRAEENTANLEAIRMSTEGKKSVDFALSVLTEFYSKAFIQKEAYTPPNAGRDGKTVGDMAPKTSFEGKYHGNTDASKGILGILEVIASDFERTKAAVEKDEADAEKKFQEFKKTTEDDNDAKNKEVTAAEKKVSDLQDAIVTHTDDNKGAVKSLAGAEATLEDLKKMCVDGEETYKERVDTRREEIEALKEALEIFRNWKA